MEALSEGVQRAGPDVAVDDAQRDQREARQPPPAGGERLDAGERSRTTDRRGPYSERTSGASTRCSLRNHTCISLVRITRALDVRQRLVGAPERVGEVPEVDQRRLIAVLLSQ